MPTQKPLPREIQKVFTSTFQHLTVGLPVSAIQALASLPGMSASKIDVLLAKAVGQVLVQYIADLGPIYGKLCQIFMSRSNERTSRIFAKFDLDRLYSDWPAVPFSTIETILDREIPQWRKEFHVERTPLGVASMAQVHVAKDNAGKEWIIKVLKPKSIERMGESVQALRSIFAALAPIAVTQSFRKSLEEAEHLCANLLRETSLTYEKENILRAQEKFKGSRTKIMRVPELHPEFSSQNVLVMERFHGTSIQKIVTGQVQLTESDRKELAKDVLKELLIQVFEWGFFHGDPHSGNLMILKEGGIGLFDWGLAGELSEKDRQHIAGILRSVMTLDKEKLIEVLQDMGQTPDKKAPSKEKIRKEIQKMMDSIQKSQESGDPYSLQELIEMTLQSAGRLKVEIPNGLLMMAKTLITVEGLARGLDGNISMARVAGPVLFRAAKPSVGDMFKMVAKSPSFIRKLF